MRKSKNAKKLTQIIQEIHSQCPTDLQVSKRLVNPDPLISRVQDHLNSEQPFWNSSYKGLIRASHGYVNITVTKDNVNRMCRFINTFIKLLRKRGHKFFIDNYETVIVVNGEKYPIKFREKCNRKYDNSGSYPSSYLVPNGKLCVKLIHCFNSKEWSGTTYVPLEDKLVDIVAGFELRAEMDKQRQAELERAWAERDRLKAIEEEKLAHEEWERKKVEILIQHADQWRKTCMIGEYISTLEQKCKSERLTSTAQEWLEWAKGVHKTMDPYPGNMDEYVLHYEFPEKI